MKLSNNTLKRLYFGALSLIEEDGYLYADRGAYNQHDYLTSEYKQSNFSEILMNGSSIFIKFKTDAKRVSFKYNISLCLNIACSFDVFVDGIPYIFARLDNLNSNGEFEINMQSGQKTVEIFLPLDARLGVKDFVIEGKWRSVKKGKTKVLWYGDSITEGYGAYYSSLIYPTQVIRELNYDSINQGIGGYYHDKKFCIRLPGFIPDKIIIALGTNNIGRVNNFKFVEEFYEKLIHVFPNRKILTITPLWRGDSVDQQLLSQTRQFINQTASKYGDVIDGLTLLPHLEAYYMDKLHPNALGMTVLAKNLINQIKKLKF